MRITVAEPYRSGICYVREDNKLGMVLDDYKLGNSLHGVATHEFVPDTRSGIPKVKSATRINQVESATTINYDAVISNKFGINDV